jgi:hypothetical protein
VLLVYRSDTVGLDLVVRRIDLVVRATKMRVSNGLRSRPSTASQAIPNFHRVVPNRIVLCRQVIHEHSRVGIRVSVRATINATA